MYIFVYELTTKLFEEIYTYVNTKKKNNSMNL